MCKEKVTQNLLTLSRTTVDLHDKKNTKNTKKKNKHQNKKYQKPIFGFCPNCEISYNMIDSYYLIEELTSMFGRYQLFLKDNMKR